MQAGQMRQRVRFETKVTVLDPDYGTQNNSWQVFATVWAEVKEILPSKAEIQSQGIRIENRPATVRIRYLLGINSDMRMMWIGRNDKEYRVVAGPAEIGNRRYMELMVEAYSTNGNAP